MNIHPKHSGQDGIHLGWHTFMGRLVTVISVLILILLVVSVIFTYQVSKNSLVSDFKNTSLVITKQTENYIESLLATVDSVNSNLYSDSKFMSMITTKSKNEKTLHNIRLKIKDILTQTAINNSFTIISGITFYSGKGITSSFPNESRTTSSSIKEYNMLPQREWYSSVLRHSGKPFWFGSHMETIVEGQEDQYVSSITTIKDSSNQNLLGILKVDVKSSILSRILKEVALGKDGYLFIANQNGQIVASPNEKLNGTSISKNILSKIEKKKDQSFMCNINGMKYNASSIYSSYNNWTYVAVIPYTEVLNTSSKLGYNIFYITIICLVLCLVTLIFLSRKLTKPIYEISELTNELANGNLAIESRSYSIREIQLLSQNFNHMIAQLNTLISSCSTLTNETDASSHEINHIMDELSLNVRNVYFAIEKITQGSIEQAKSMSDCAIISDKLDTKLYKANLQLSEIIELCVQVHVAKNEPIIDNETVNQILVQIHGLINSLQGDIQLITSEKKNLTKNITSISNISSDNASSCEEVMDSMQQQQQLTNHLSAISSRLNQKSYQLKHLF